VSSEDNGPQNDYRVRNPDGGDDPTHGRLWPTVADFHAFVKGLKPGRPDDILVAAIAGPSTPYQVVPVNNVFEPGEMAPSVSHSCTFPSDDPGQPEFADPAVRINQWVQLFDTNGVRYPICAMNLEPAMTGIAEKIQKRLGASCLSDHIRWKEPTNHDKGHNCTVSRITKNDDTKVEMTSALQECLPIATNADSPEAPTNAPCFQLLPAHQKCAKSATTLFRICDNAACGPVTTSGESKRASVACALE
jgi:hypothetical protein